MDWIIEALLRLWEMYKANPVFWIILSPFILWWLNFLRKQINETGIIKLIPRLFHFTEDRLLTLRKTRRPSVLPSPKSDSPVIFWRDVLIWPLMMSPFVIFIAFTANDPFSSQWWLLFGWSILILMGFFGAPIYVSVLVIWLKTNKEIKEAAAKLSQTNVDNDENGTYLDVFIAISDDLQMGLDPRVLPLIYKQQISALSFLELLLSLGLVKPDRKTEHGSLANRYYLTREGSTFAQQIKKGKYKK